MVTNLRKENDFNKRTFSEWAEKAGASLQSVGLHQQGPSRLSDKYNDPSKIGLEEFIKYITTYMGTQQHGPYNEMAAQIAAKTRESQPQYASASTQGTKIRKHKGKFPEFESMETASYIVEFNTQDNILCLKTLRRRIFLSSTNAKGTGVRRPTGISAKEINAITNKNKYDKLVRTNYTLETLHPKRGKSNSEPPISEEGTNITSLEYIQQYEYRFLIKYQIHPGDTYYYGTLRTYKSDESGNLITELDKHIMSFNK
jgi:hypothetical protein